MHGAVDVLFTDRIYNVFIRTIAAFEGAKEIKMISVKGLTKKYVTGKTDFFALSGVDMEIGDGEFVAITGKSGSGKSTLLNIIGTLDEPTSGVVTVDGEDISKFRPKAVAAYRNKTVGFVFQAFYLEPSYTVYDNVELPLILAGKTGDNGDKINAALNMVGLGHKSAEKARTLSGGEQQRVAIARAIVNDPRYILADEPCGNLDTINSDNVMKILADLHAQGKTVIMVTHDAEDAAKASRIVTMSDGKIVKDEKTA